MRKIYLISSFTLICFTIPANFLAYLGLYLFPETMTGLFANPNGMIDFCGDFPSCQGWVNLAPQYGITKDVSVLFNVSIIVGAISIFSPFTFFKYEKSDIDFIRKIPIYIFIELFLLSLLFKERTEIPSMPSVHFLYSSIFGYAYHAVGNSVILYLIGIILAGLTKFAIFELKNRN